MKIYSIAIMVISAFTIAIVSLCFMFDLVQFINPEIAVEGSDYKKFISFEYFKTQELKNSIDSKYGPDLTKLTDNEWSTRWETFKNVTLLEEKHDSKNRYGSRDYYTYSFSRVLRRTFLSL